MSATGFGLAVLAASRQQRAGEVAELVVVLFCAFNCGGSDSAELLLPSLGLELALAFEPPRPAFGDESDVRARSPAPPDFVAALSFSVLTPQVPRALRARSARRGVRILRWVGLTTWKRRRHRWGSRATDMRVYS